MKEEEQFIELCKVRDILLGENGCAWDKAQTHKSLRNLLLEESYETADAIDQEDMAALKEELGDILLHVLLHSRIAENDGHFNLADVMGHVAEKLVRRHSHIFGGDTANSPHTVEETWEANKIKEKALFTPLENMQAVARALPALERASKVAKRSGKDFPRKATIKKLRFLIDDLEENPDSMESYGKILFLITALSTKMQINAEFSLTNATQAFINSFKQVIE
jgi:tetrapyrrole methylase family protein/MazG family protein